MNVLVPQLDPLNIIVKPPVYTTQGQLMSEIWYRHEGKIIQPVIQTPRLKVRFGARRLGQGPYSYCVSLQNMDIDPEIEEFYHMIQALDKHVVNLLLSADWNWNEKVPHKYWSAMKRRLEEGRNDSFYMQFKVLMESDKLLTAIHDDSRVARRPEDIVYGCYTDQYVGPAYILYVENGSNAGIHLIWHSHQVVISHIEKVFLARSLLDNIAPTNTIDTANTHAHFYSPYMNMGGVPQPPPPPPPPPALVPSAPLHPSSTQAVRVATGITSSSSAACSNRIGLSHIKESDIRNALKKLRKTAIATDDD